MTPAQLTSTSFAGYPPEARQMAASQVDVLQRLPLAFLPLLLRELIVYDWKFPVERQDLNRQFALLRSLSDAQFSQWMNPFSQLQLTPELATLDWVNNPAQFSEHLTNHLWTTHQIDQFRSAATEYVSKLNAAAPDARPSRSRFTIVVVGRGAPKPSRPLFVKLRNQGKYYSRLKPEGGMAAMLRKAQARAVDYPEPFQHWYVDGAEAPEKIPASLTSVSYNALSPVRAQLLKVIDQNIRSGVGAEALRTTLARMDARDVGLQASGPQGVLNQFQLSLLTEGSGTQIFSTTFVQWAAREILRRAQPVTLLARFTPRRYEQSLKEILDARQTEPSLDPAASLVDAEMGAYYTWLNQRRLTGAEGAAFAVWYEGQSDAVVIAPGFAPGTESTEKLTLADLLDHDLLKRIA